MHAHIPANRPLHLMSARHSWINSILMTRSRKNCSWITDITSPRGNKDDRTFGIVATKARCAAAFPAHDCSAFPSHRGDARISCESLSPEFDPSVRKFPDCVSAARADAY